MYVRPRARLGATIPEQSRFHLPEASPEVLFLGAGVVSLGLVGFVLYKIFKKVRR